MKFFVLLSIIPNMLKKLIFLKKKTQKNNVESLDLKFIYGKQKEEGPHS
jgi:hypothetical protein